MRVARRAGSGSNGLVTKPPSSAAVSVNTSLEATRAAEATDAPDPVCRRSGANLFRPPAVQADRAVLSVTKGMGWQYALGYLYKDAMSKPPDLVQGTLDLLLLKIIALEPLHGWAISQRLTQVSNEELQVSEGSLYPALHKLELAGWISAEWKTSDLGRRAKFYSLTRAGRRRLDQEAEQWRRLSSAITRVLQLKEI